MKEIDRIANEIADVLLIHPDSVNLSQISGNWIADVISSGKIIEGETVDDPILAMKSLLEKARKTKREQSKLFS